MAKSKTLVKKSILSNKLSVFSTKNLIFRPKNLINSEKCLLNKKILIPDYLKIQISDYPRTNNACEGWHNKISQLISHIEAGRDPPAKQPKLYAIFECYCAQYTIVNRNVDIIGSIHSRDVCVRHIYFLINFNINNFWLFFLLQLIHTQTIISTVCFPVCVWSVSY